MTCPNGYVMDLQKEVVATDANGYVVNADKKVMATYKKGYVVNIKQKDSGKRLCRMKSRPCK